MKMLSLYFDGSYGPKFPDGIAAYAFSIPELDVNESGRIGSGPGYSVNYAEFYALYKGLEYAKTCTFPLVEEHTINVYGDSQLVINIMNNKWKIDKSKLYYPAYLLAKEIDYDLKYMEGIPVEYNWIPREQNTKTDKASKYQNFI